MFKIGCILWRGRRKVSVNLLVPKYKNDDSDSLATHGEVIFLPISIVKTPADAGPLA